MAEPPPPDPVRICGDGFACLAPDCSCPTRPPGPARVCKCDGNCKCAKDSFRFSLYAFNMGNESSQDLRRERLPREKLGEAVEWAVAAGCDYINIQRLPGRPFHPGLVHHVCGDPACPGGC